MVGFLNYREFATAVDNGQSITTHFRKVPSQTTVAGQWFDLSMASGNPVPQYYADAPLESSAFNGLRGIWRGTDVSPSRKYLSEVMLCTPTTGFVGQYKLLDYLLFYPFVDCDVTDVQTMTEVATIPRYTDGAGVQVMMVCQAPNTTTGTFTFDYINQDGALKTSPVQTVPSTIINIASVMSAVPTTTGTGPFLRLASGDTGVRRIVSVTFSVPAGGLAALVLVQPIGDFVVREINTPVEKTMLGMRSLGARVVDGAYLNFIVQTASTVAGGSLTGRLNFVWN